MKRLEYHWGDIINPVTGTVFWADAGTRNKKRLAWVLCGSCGRKYQVDLSSVKNSNRLCPVCGRKKGDKNRMKYHNGDILNEETGSKLIQRDINDSNKGVVECGRCHRAYYTNIASVVSGTLCKKCGYEIVSEKERKYQEGDILEAPNGLRFLFIKELEPDGNLRMGEFVEVDVNSQQIGQSFVSRPSAVATGRVNGQGASNGEKVFRQMLEEYNIPFQEQVKFPDLRGARGGKLSYDFAISLDGDKMLLIEIDGAQHYEEIEYFGGAEKLYWQKQNDSIKDEYAKTNGYPLLRLKSTDVITSSSNSNYKIISSFIQGGE